MKELNDEELQRLLDEGKQISSANELDGDVKAYKILFEALNSEPENGLPYDFAAKVTRHVQAEQKRGKELKYNLAMVLIFIGLIAATCGIMAAYGTISIDVVLKYKWFLVLLPVIFIAIQYFDQVLVKTKFFRNNTNN